MDTVTKAEFYTLTYKCSVGEGWDGMGWDGMGREVNCGEDVKGA
jgi:hypothetical protein